MDEFFAIFNPDWWLNENNSALEIADATLFLLLLIPVAYILIYAIASLTKYHNPYPTAKRRHRFLVLFSVLRNGKQVIESVNLFLDTQQYPRDKYDIVVAATQLSEEDLQTLLQMPVTIVVPDKDDCTKTYAIQQVMERYSPKEYDAIVLFNSDNRVVPNALELLNNAYYSGCDAIQAHRMAENLDNPLAVLSAATEEFNNRLFRKAHTKLGFSSALIGSSMMFDFEMFHRIAPRLKGDDLTTAIEIELLRENTYTEYMEEIICYCKKTEDPSQYSRRRQRWIGIQIRNTWKAFWQFPLAFLQGKWDLCEKLLQWLMPSRFMLVIYIIVCTIVITYLDWTLSPKWYMLAAVLFIAFLMALPEGEINKRLRKSLWSIPGALLKSLFSRGKESKS